MFYLKTNHPVAYDSKDHLYPEGVFWDNNVSLDFVRSVELYFGKKIDFMDHESVFPESWWLEKCDKYFERIDYPFGITNRGIHKHLLFCGRKK